ncbi:hypothetical protein OF83DRAFT_1173684 [Amylostereum chailletii]|nr:hypothetical protein OF83DRAFT_1173684 [Amylostereum chailletii]
MAPVGPGRFPELHLHDSLHVVTTYAALDHAWVSAIAAASALSALAVLQVAQLQIALPSKHLTNHTHVCSYLFSLLLSNALQAIGTLINVQWVVDGGVSGGMLCRAQGGVKQAGNVGTALWSFMLALHAFNLLFLRRPSTKLGNRLTLGIGWAAVALVVVLGPAALQTPAKGPYFGPSGFWCWITHAYPYEQLFLEYFFVRPPLFAPVPPPRASHIAFFLYAALLLRVRGNIRRTADGKWSLRWVAPGESWKLGLARDYVDQSLLRITAVVVWHPVAYTVLVLPITVTRFISFAGRNVPSSATFLADLIYGLGGTHLPPSSPPRPPLSTAPDGARPRLGLANVLLLLLSRRSIPDPSVLPHLATPRAPLANDGPERTGITPFLAPAPVVLDIR